MRMWEWRVVACKSVVRVRGQVWDLGRPWRGSDEHEDKESRRCRAQIISFAAVLRGRESPSNGLQLGKRTRGMFGPRVVGEGMERGNGESITANAMTNRPTNVPIECPFPRSCFAVVLPTEQTFCLILNENLTACRGHANVHRHHETWQRAAKEISLKLWKPLSTRFGDLVPLERLSFRDVWKPLSTTNFGVSMKNFPMIFHCYDDISTCWKHTKNSSR